MKIDKSFYDYFWNKSFHNGLIFPLDNQKRFSYQFIESRIDLIKKIASGKRVLHIGCADHIELIDDKRNKGTWLHEKLTKHSSHCIGLDINQKAVEYIRESIGLSNVFCVDISSKKLPDWLKKEQWDLIILGEIIEHLGDPVSFLRSIQTNINGTRILITAPNAFRWNNFKNARHKIECINSDHRFWFTPYTLSKVAADAGFTPIKFVFVESFRWSFSRCLKNPVHFMRLITNHVYCDTLLLTADF